MRVYAHRFPIMQTSHANSLPLVLPEDRCLCLHLSRDSTQLSTHLTCCCIPAKEQKLIQQHCKLPASFYPKVSRVGISLRPCLHICYSFLFSGLILCPLHISFSALFLYSSCASFQQCLILLLAAVVPSFALLGVSAQQIQLKKNLRQILTVLSIQSHCLF